MKNPDSKIRHYCTCCNSKLYESDLQEIYYPLLKKSFWHCEKCMSINVDNLHQKISKKQPYLIEFFSGSKTVSKIANQFNYKTFTIDIEEKFNPDLQADVLKLRFNSIPGTDNVFIVWASIPCTFYTILNISNHWEKIIYASRKYFYLPKTKEARSAIKLLEKTLYLIKKINPTYFFIENPRGALRHMPQMRNIPLHTVSYNDYGLDYYKPTDIFTNCSFLELKKIKTAVGRIFPGSVTNLNSAYERSIVPEMLIEDILKQIQTKHFN